MVEASRLFARSFQVEPFPLQLDPPLSQTDPFPLQLGLPLPQHPPQRLRALHWIYAATQLCSKFSPVVESVSGLEYCGLWESTFVLGHLPGSPGRLVCCRVVLRSEPLIHSTIHMRTPEPQTLSTYLVNPASFPPLPLRSALSSGSVLSGPAASSRDIAWIFSLTQ